MGDLARLRLFYSEALGVTIYRCPAECGQSRASRPWHRGNVCPVCRAEGTVGEHTARAYLEVGADGWEAYQRAEAERGHIV
jgi:hypothetical protein